MTTLRTVPQIARGARTFATQAALQRTPLHSFHVQRGAKMVEFCGYDMPVQYKEGVLTEHLACRQKAAIFDVSHMGQLHVEGKDRIAFMESLCVADISAATDGKSQLSVLTNGEGWHYRRSDCDSHS
eukprot:EC724556.1.p1 GENE.EC724556.1~~EC724556.1.p1  ORF type:complete len:135 (+),score=15.28 EC724556.1:26-406(+)